MDRKALKAKTPDEQREWFAENAKFNSQIYPSHNGGYSVLVGAKILHHWDLDKLIEMFDSFVNKGVVIS